MRISQDELEQKKQVLSTSFEAKSVERRRLHTSSVPRARLGESLPRGNNRQPIKTSYDHHENKTNNRNENIQTDYFEDLLNQDQDDQKFDHSYHNHKSTGPRILQDSGRETAFLNLGATTTLSNTFSKIPHCDHKGMIFTQ